MSEGRDVVRIELPADTRYVALSRVAAASLASDLDADLDEVDDLRVAVDELVGFLVATAGPGGTVQLELCVEGDAVTVAGRCTEVSGAGASAQLDELTRRILEATVDSWEATDDAFRLRKRVSTR